MNKPPEIDLHRLESLLCKLHSVLYILKPYSWHSFRSLNVDALLQETLNAIVALNEVNRLHPQKQTANPAPGTPEHRP
jgi:hypothetical protein